MTAVPKSFDITVQSSGLPTYLQGKADWQWTQVATQASEKVASQISSPNAGSTMVNPPWGDWSQDSWCGGCVDQSRKELIRPANGGHTSTPDNATYACNLGLDAPKWRRLTTRSPDSVLQTSRTLPLPTAPNPQLFSDGYGPSMHHASSVQFQDGRIWWTQQSSTTGADEAGTATPTERFNGNWIIPAAISLDRDAMGAGPITDNDSRYPLSYAASNLWRAHGRTASQFFTNVMTTFGTSAALPSRHRVYGFHDAAFLSNEYSITNTAPGATESTRASTATANISLGFMAWAVGCDDLDIVVCGRDGLHGAPSELRVLNAATGQWHTVSAPSGYRWDEYDAGSVDKFQYGYNAVYHAGSHSILLYEWNMSSSGKIRRLKIPTVNGVYQQGGPWSWSEITTTGFTSNGSRVSGKNTYGRFNIINDIGGGNAALVLHPTTDHAVYVCKIGALS